MTGTSSRPFIPPAALTSSIARTVPLSWLRSMTAVTPVCENKPPARHGSSPRSFRAICPALPDGGLDRRLSLSCRVLCARPHVRPRDPATGPAPLPPPPPRDAVCLGAAPRFVRDIAVEGARPDPPAAVDAVSLDLPCAQPMAHRGRLHAQDVRHLVGLKQFVSCHGQTCANALVRVC